MDFGKLNKCLIVAEISANHGRSFERAVRLIRAAKACGADAVKFQTYTPDTITLDSKNRHFMIKHDKWGGQTLHSLYKKSYTPWEWFKRLKKTADRLGILFFSTAFDRSSVDFLEDLKVPVHKISSFELVDTPLIKYASKTGKPVIISTGMAAEKEVRQAVQAARSGGAPCVALLKCVSSYPASVDEMNLATLPDMKKRFKCDAVGISDHSLAIEPAIVSVALGGRIMEKHFTLSRSLKTPDSFFSIEPSGLKELVRSVRSAESSMGRIFYGLTPDERKCRVFRRSLFAVRDIDRGEAFSEYNVRSIRPAAGLAPAYLPMITGKRAKCFIKKGTPLKLEFVDRGGVN